MDSIAKLFTVTSIAFLAVTTIQAQSIDGSMTVNGTSRSYSLYIPSTYDEGVPNPVILAMHPLNPFRWNAESWRDTLIAFAERTGTIIVCPDGGADGNIINDRTDTALASALLDSVANWYTASEARTYVLGFSMGGAATYQYGLARADRFGGFIPIGAAVDGTSAFESLLPQSVGTPFYVIHGDLDIPERRYTPVVEALRNNGAIVNALLLEDVGHTIDFPDRNRILERAYAWIDSVNTSDVASIGSHPSVNGSAPTLPSSVVRVGEPLQFESDAPIRSAVIRIADVAGSVVYSSELHGNGRGILSVALPRLPTGPYFVRIETSDGTGTHTVIIQ